MRVLALALGMALAGATASAIVIEPQNYTVNFRGDCIVDCTGIAEGTLQLEDYILGDVFTTVHFVSLVYSSSFMNVEFHAGDLDLDVEGVIFGDGTGAVSIINSTDSFSAQLNGFWCVNDKSSCNLESNQDAGDNARWLVADNTVPEPGTFALVGVGLGGLWFRRRLVGLRRGAS